jgi:excisionase family DNA binding protein
MSDIEQLPDLLTTMEVAKYLRVSRLTIYRYNKRGLLTPVKRLGKRVLYRKEDVIKLLE